MLRGLRALLAPATAGLPVACSSPEDTRSGTWRGHVETVGDTTVVHTVAGAVWAAAELVPDLRIGTREGLDHEMFGTIHGLAASPTADSPCSRMAEANFADARRSSRRVCTPSLVMITSQSPSQVTVARE